MDPASGHVSDEASAGLPFLSNRFDASNLFVTWRSPITGAGWGRGGQAQTVANESGRWSGEVGGTLAPFITFSGVNRGDTINLPTKILVSAITKDSLPIAEFNFGQNGGEYLLWRANPTDSGWTRNGNSICGPISTVKKSDGTSVQSATCQFVPLSDAQNVQLWAVGYVEDHRVFKSESVYANIQTLRPFISSGIHFSPKKDASGEFVSAEISGTIQKLPSGTVVRICLEGKNPTNSGQNTLECQSGTVDVSSGYKLNFAVPHVWNLHYYVESLESPYKIGNGGTTDAYGDWENAKYECQNQGGCLSKVQTASANKSRYSEGYAAIKEATLSSLRTLQFFGYFSPNHKLTKQNAVNWCNQVVSMLPFHGGWGPNAISTWAQGCTTAALKIPYSK